MIKYKQQGDLCLFFAPCTVHIIFDSRSAACGSRGEVSPKVGTPPRKSTLIYQRTFSHTSPFFERGFFLRVFRVLDFSGCINPPPQKQKRELDPFLGTPHRTVIKDYRPIAYSPMYLSTTSSRSWNNSLETAALASSWLIPSALWRW